jgi:Lsr2
MDITTRVCDMPGGSHAAGEAARREFAIDGQDLEIDLCPAHDQAFTGIVSKWAQAATPVPGRRYAPRGGGRTRAQRDRAAAIRAWAVSQGKGIEEHGRIPVSVVRDYDRAHGLA